MTEYGMGDEATINEIINDVDTDNVSYLSIYPSTSISPNMMNTQACFNLLICSLMQDGRINYEEFVDMMKKGSHEPSGNRA